MLDHYIENDFLAEHLRQKYKCDISASSTMGMVQAYESATTLIGQDPLENGKTMGLSAYGDKENVTPDLFYENITVK